MPRAARLAPPSPLPCIDGVAERLAGLERRRRRGGDGDDLAGAGVAPLACRPALRRERPESGDGDGVALGETVADGGEDGGDHPVGGVSVEGELRGQLRAEFGPVHVVLPL